MKETKYYREFGKTDFTYSKERVKAFNKNKGAIVVCCTENEMQRLIKCGVKKSKIIRTDIPIEIENKFYANEPLWKK